MQFPGFFWRHTNTDTSTDVKGNKGEKKRTENLKGKKHNPVRFVEN